MGAVGNQVMRKGLGNWGACRYSQHHIEQDKGLPFLWGGGGNLLMAWKWQDLGDGFGGSCARDKGVSVLGRTDSQPFSG